MNSEYLEFGKVKLAARHSVTKSLLSVFVDDRDPPAGRPRVATIRPRSGQDAGMAERHFISSGSRFEADMGYSRAVVDGDWVFVSGTTGFDYAAGTIAEDVVAQSLSGCC